MNPPHSNPSGDGGPRIRSPPGKGNKPVALADITNTGKPNAARSITVPDLVKVNFVTFAPTISVRFLLEIGSLSSIIALIVAGEHQVADSAQREDVCCLDSAGVSVSGCEVRAGAIAICFLIDVAYLSFSAERLLTSAGLRYTSSVLPCKHQSNRIYTLHKPIRRCLRFVYNSTSPSTPCLTMDTLTLIFCSCVLFLCWQSNWMWHAILQVMPVHHNNDIFSKGKVQVCPF